jgi:hypothetical protein
MPNVDWISLAILGLMLAVQFTNGATRTFLVQAGAVRPEVLKMAFDTAGIENNSEAFVAQSNRWTGVTGLVKWAFVVAYAVIDGVLSAAILFLGANVAGFIACVGFARVAGGAPNSLLMKHSRLLLATTAIALPAWLITNTWLM